MSAAHVPWMYRCAGQVHSLLHTDEVVVCASPGVSCCPLAVIDGRLSEEGTLHISPRSMIGTLTCHSSSSVNSSQQTTS